MDKKIRLYEIFLTFLYSGLIMLGGGYVILPILQTELVEKRKWLTAEELTDYYAISQSLPGLISINISVLTGYKLRGKFGALAGVLGITFFAFWAIVILSSIIMNYSSNPYIQGAFWGIEIAVVVLIFSAIREMWVKSVNDFATSIVFIISLAVMIYTDMSPAIIIIISAFVGIVYNLLTSKKGGAKI